MYNRAKKGKAMPTMKVSNKGQVVIPAAIRKRFGIDVGDILEVTLDTGNQAIRLSKIETSRCGTLAGSLSEYAKGRKFPSRRQIHRALEKELSGAKTSR
jgi:AbrB family looped-hinge helix DNA binding protein